MQPHDNEKHIEELIEADELSLSVSDVEAISQNKFTRQFYEWKYKKGLYSALLMSLTHESYPEKQAKHLWKNIIKHRISLTLLLNRDVGILVAVLDYLSNIEPLLRSPKIIEENKSAYVSRASTKDELTQLYLRDVFEIVLKKEVSESKRNQRVVSLLLLDIDDFKTINDEYGHLRGDEVLSAVGRCINGCIREMDLGARYGGDELAIIMPQTQIDEAYTMSKRVQTAIAQIDVKDIKVTTSIGVSGLSDKFDTAEKLIDAADQALYISKTNGKNTISIAESCELIN